MELTATRHREIVRLLDEIDSEMRGKCRMLRILNLTRRIRLEIRKSARYDRHCRYGAQVD